MKNLTDKVEVNAEHRDWVLIHSILKAEYDRRRLEYGTYPTEGQRHALNDIAHCLVACEDAADPFS